MTDLIPIVLFALVIAIIVGVWGSILRRIGYSWWTALLQLVPFVNLVALMAVAAKQWPIERELARLRLISGESVDIESDIESVMSFAIVCEQKREWERAASLYNLAADKSTDEKVKQYATECAQRIGDAR